MLNILMITKYKQAFTLIEIIIALTLVAVFITLPVLAYGSYAKTSRDTQRKNDVNKIQSALELYKANTGSYPSEDTWKDVLVDGGYLSEIPEDLYDGRAAPGDNGLAYGYAYQNIDNGFSYQLSARLENNDPNHPDGTYYIVGPGGAGIASAAIVPNNFGTGFPSPTMVGSSNLPPSQLATNTPTPIVSPTVASTNAPAASNTVAPSNSIAPSNTTTPPSPTPRKCWGINGNCDAACTVSSYATVATYSSCTAASCWRYNNTKCNYFNSYKEGFANSSNCSSNSIFFQTPEANGSSLCSSNGTGSCYYPAPEGDTYTYTTSTALYLKTFPAGTCSYFNTYSAGTKQSYVSFVRPSSCTWGANATACGVTLATSAGSKRYITASSCATNGSGNCYKATSPTVGYDGTQNANNCTQRTYYTMTPCTYYAN